MIKELRLRKATRPKHLTDMDSGDALATTVQELEHCGWFVTHVIHQELVVSLFSTVNYSDYTLRADNVSDCYLLKDSPNSCSLCKTLRKN